MPDITDSTDFTPLADIRTVTLLLGEDGRVDWYWGILDKPLAGPYSTAMGKDGIREVLLQKKDEVPKLTDDGKGLIVVIRPSARAAYASSVDALDEMRICGIKPVHDWRDQPGRGGHALTCAVRHRKPGCSSQDLGVRHKSGNG